MAGAGLGLRLHDNRHGTSFHDEAFAPWWRYAREHYLGLTASTPPTTTTFYYDPLRDVHHTLPVSAALTTAFYAAPQAPDDARTLFEAGINVLGLDNVAAPIRASRAFGSSLVLAREWGMTDVERVLVDLIEASYEPTWDRASGEFTWGMGLGEEHPRGQFNAFLAAAELAGAGRWAQLSAGPVPRCPQVVGVDFPNVALSRAEWIDGNLYLRLAPRVADPSRRTTFRIVGAEPRQWDIAGIDGVTAELTGGGLTLRVPMVHGDLELTRGSY